MLGTALLLISSVYALSPSDFYCAEAPAPGTTSYRMGFKSCGGKTEAVENLCVVNAFCAHVTDDMKLALSKSTPQEAKNYIKNLRYPNGWWPATLSCRALKPVQLDTNGQLIQPAMCPPPEECKGDAFFEMSAALIDIDKEAALEKKVLQDHVDGAFPYGKEIK